MTPQGSLIELKAPWIDPHPSPKQNCSKHSWLVGIEGVSTM